jgi:GNAT superfamily N-acetyltransferase
MRVTIRATHDDDDEIARLDRECFADEASPVDLDTHNPECWLAVTAEGAPVAYAVAVLIDGVAYLRRVGVVPEARGHGLQRRLIRARVAWARGVGASRVETYTAHDNPYSMASLIACGFRPHVPPWAYVGAGVVYWRKDLST